MDTSITEYFYSDSGLLISEHYCDLGNDFCNDNIYEFNQNGQPSAVIVYSAKGDSISRIEYDYNTDGLEIERRIYSAFVIGGNLLYTYQFEYNSNREITSRRYFTADGKVKSYNVFEYQNGLYIKSIVDPIKGKKIIEEISYVFDEVGNWVSKTSRVNGKITGFVTREIIYKKN
ncbi:hypothetical protein K6119_11260 [Paracrocinitomix mangrovi]|uniref:hypothetical protein n=1 Tax=Paracrocinitomix mangrovi TaxID=2862509 RepID=UPI001EDB3FDE|nr:hypothetical protein [Paracrocinitomix mangrovi]UKN00312.1 hypothetical protein K6119_11260 [Paracrocinitomix mangrovi]